MRMHKIEEKEEISKIKSAMDKLHGSDLGYSYEWSVKGGNLVLKTYHHVMDDHGDYVAIIPVTVWFPLNNPEKFKVRCGNTRSCLEIRYMLTYSIYNALIEEA